MSQVSKSIPRASNFFPEEPVGPVEKISHSFPSPSSKAKHTTIVSHLTDSETFVLVSRQVPGARAPKECHIDRGFEHGGSLGEGYRYASEQTPVSPESPICSRQSILDLHFISVVEGHVRSRDLEANCCLRPERAFSIDLFVQSLHPLGWHTT